MVIGYSICFALALGLMVAYFILLKNKEFWLGLLYVCVTIVNLGYLLLSLSKSLEFAIFANDLAYLGSVFLSACMFLTITKLCGFRITKAHVITCVSLGVLMFLIVATSGVLPWYYKSLSFEVVNGGGKLLKEYGPLHKVYMLYLLGYFISMIVTIIISITKKKAGSNKFAALIAGVVCGNIIVWLFEKFIPWQFEFLAVTYIMSEIMFLFLYWMMQDYVLASQVERKSVAEQMQLGIDVATMPMEIKIGKVLLNLKEGEILSAREREILELILLNKKRKEIAEQLHLSENTVKTYTRTLYIKLCVSSREELYSLLIKS